MVKFDFDTYSKNYIDEEIFNKNFNRKEEVFSKFNNSEMIGWTRKVDNNVIEIIKDNIYITRRDKENYFECVRYSDFVKRNELLKSKVILENVINGTAPRYQDLENGRKWK